MSQRSRTPQQAHKAEAVLWHCLHTLPP